MAILYTTRTKECAQRLVTIGCSHPSLGLFGIKVCDLLNPYIYLMHVLYVMYEYLHTSYNFINKNPKGGERVTLQKCLVVEKKHNRK